MKIQELIASGILESYALGLASPRETAELERLLPLHPPLQDALSEFEYRLESFAIQHEVPPPPGVLEKIRQRIGDKSVVRRKYRRQEDQGKDAGPGYIHVKTTSPYISVHRSWRTIFIVVFLLSKVFLGLFIYYLIKYEHATRDNLQLQHQLTRPAATVVPASAAPAATSEGQDK